MIQQNSTVVQCICDTTVAISSLVFMVDCCYFRLGLGILIPFVLPFAVIIECRPGQLRNFQQHIYFKFLPQFQNYFRFLLLCCSSYKTKACNFFRYAISALKR